jgi:IMP dehydrogenase
MTMIEILEGLTFDDVLLVPQFSTVSSRSKVDLSVRMGRLEFAHPVIPANMSSVTGYDMALQVAYGGGLAILHRFMPLEEQLQNVRDMINSHGPTNFGVSIGVKEEDLKNFKKFHNLGVRIACIDIAHGHSQSCIDVIRLLKRDYQDTTIIAGNVATGYGARVLWEAGADIVKVGVGPGSLCTTRIETGNGVPQLTALMDVKEVQQKLRDLEAQRYPYSDEISKRKTFPFIADGGIKNAGDIVKALCFADMVMVGNLFAGCVETPGEIHVMSGIPHKEYRGSSTHKANHIEGVAAWVPCTGKYKNVLTKLLEGLRSGCSYQGADSLIELKDSPTFIRITSAGLRESHPHDVIIK